MQFLIVHLKISLGSNLNHSNLLNIFILGSYSTYHCNNYGKHFVLVYFNVVPYVLVVLVQQRIITISSHKN